MTDASKSKESSPDEMVTTPGGPRHKSLVHQLKKGHVYRVKEGVSEVVDEKGNVVRDLKPAGPTKSQPPGFGTGWIAFTYWNNDTSSPISSFKTTWTVPQPPATQSGQLLYLFNGMQVTVGGNDPATSGLHILQPVLQWGVSPDGGGNNWAVASWFVGSNTQVAIKSALTSVNPGDTLVGVMTLSSQSNNVFTYDCEFQGIANSKITIQMTPAPAQAVETLEVYGITQCSDYPGSDYTAFTGIAIETMSGTPTIEWTVQNAVTDCNQHALVLSNSATDGEVEIFCRNPVIKNPPPPPEICEQLSIEIGNLEETILMVTRQPPSPGQQAELHALELQLGKLQQKYQQQCAGHHAMRAKAMV